MFPVHLTKYHFKALSKVSIMKHVILCADDYGHNSAISQAIINLINNKRLSATSCITTSEDWLKHAANLRPFIDQVDLGLHFNLTEGVPLSKGLESFMDLSVLIKKSYLGKLKKKLIKDELNAQLDRYIEGMGRVPDFLDGHQHVHQFPIVRDAVFCVYDERLRQNNSYIRSVYSSKSLLKMTKSGYLKGLTIQLCGAISFKIQLLRRKIPHNTSFSGIYDFSDAKLYANIFQQFLLEVSDNGLIMCHPGVDNSCKNDLIAHSRVEEYAFLASEDLINICQKNKILLARFRQ